MSGALATFQSHTFFIDNAQAGKETVSDCFSNRASKFSFYAELFVLPRYEDRRRVSVMLPHMRPGINTSTEPSKELHPPCVALGIPSSNQHPQ